MLKLIKLLLIINAIVITLVCCDNQSNTEVAINYNAIEPEYNTTRGYIYNYGSDDEKTSYNLLLIMVLSDNDINNETKSEGDVMESGIKNCLEINLYSKSPDLNAGLYYFDKTCHITESLCTPFTFDYSELVTGEIDEDYYHEIKVTDGSFEVIKKDDSYEIIMNCTFAKKKNAVIRFSGKLIRKDL